MYEETTSSHCRRNKHLLIPKKSETIYLTPIPFRLLFDNKSDHWQLNNLFGKPKARQLQKELHQRLCRAIVESGEKIPDFVSDVTEEILTDIKAIDSDKR